ncbi:MAG: nicotinamide riboside transporter PnuC [Halococcoides sp.]
MADIALRKSWDRTVAVLETWTTFEQIWLAVFSAITIALYVAWDDSLLGLIASLTGMITVVLVARGVISNYYFGIVNVVAYGFIAFQSQYYGEVMLNWGFFLPAQFVGLYLWSKNMGADGFVETSGLRWGQRLLWGLGSTAAIGGYGLFLQWLHGNLPFFDATSTVLSVIAQVLMIKRAPEQWAVWIVIDVVSIYMWSSRVLTTGQGATMVVMWSAYLVNACYGWYNWRRMDEP